MTYKSFLGIPVQGEILAGDRVAQRPLAELQPLIRALLDDDTITEFGWRQYTPYFNDGEPCLFRVSEFWVRTTTDAPEADPDDLCIGKYVPCHPSLGELVPTAGGDKRHQAGDERYEGSDEGRYRRAMALAGTLEYGGFNDVLLDAFGDHANVTVRRDGITVDFYEHD